MEEFGFGLPPRIWGKKIGETIYSINLLPIGGFVKLYGEDSSIEYPVSKLKNRAFGEKSVPKRIGVIVAGVMMNIFLAVFVFSLTYFISGIPVKTGKIKVVGITKDSPAEMVGIKIDDEVVSVDGEKMVGVDQFIKVAKERAGGLIRLEIKREKENPCILKKQVLGGGTGPDFETGCRGGNLILAIIPRSKPPVGEGALGVAISEIEMKHFPFWQMPFYGIREGLKESFAWGEAILGSLGKMVVELFTRGRVPEDVSGPIGIYQATGAAAKSGILAILEFLGILSINLAVVNILPLPALDGGRLLLLFVERFIDKKLVPKVEVWVNSLGMVFLLLLMLLITINDILRIFAANNIFEKIKIVF